MKYLDRLMEMAESEIRNVTEGGKFRTREDVDTMYKLVDIIKDITCIEDMEGGYSEAGYSGEGSYRGRSYEGGSYEGGSYARGRRNARRDSMGRYSGEGGSSRGSYRGYSRDEAKDDYIQQLEELMENAPDDKTRQDIQRMVQQMRSA